jgi:dipeptidyl aminopeptidase/acylaminoacyl peptidase
MKKFKSVLLFVTLLLIFLLNTEIYKENRTKKLSSFEELSSVDFITYSEKICLTDNENEVFLLLNENSDNYIKSTDFVNYKIRYKSDIYEVSGMISAPADYLAKKYPILIHNRGGNRDYGRENFGIIQAFASRGFIVLASNYRGVDGGTGNDEFGGGDVEDVNTLIDLAENLSFSNGKVYMNGWSRGGMMTFCALRGIDKGIDAATVFAAESNLITSFNEGDNEFKKVLVNLIGGSPRNLEEEYKKRSAIFWVDEIYTPLLIIHGEIDNTVNIRQSEVLYEKMHSIGKTVEMKVLQLAGHDVSYEIINIISEWLLNK